MGGRIGQGVSPSAHRTYDNRASDLALGKITTGHVACRTSITVCSLPEYFKSKSWAFRNMQE